VTLSQVFFITFNQQEPSKNPFYFLKNLSINTMSLSKASSSQTSCRVLRLVADLKEMLLVDLSYAIEDLEAARPLFKVIDGLEGL
jgi:hypothetical protein